MKINYKIIFRKTLLMAIKEALKEVAANKVKDFCIYISFDRLCKGIKYPAKTGDRITTILLENRFWSLNINDTGFFVELDIDGTVTEIFVPFESITIFADSTSETLIELGDWSDTLEEEDEEEEDANNDLICIDFSQNKEHME